MKNSHIKLSDGSSKGAMSKALIFDVISKIIQTPSDREGVRKRIVDTLELLDNLEIYELPTN